MKIVTANAGNTESDDKAVVRYCLRFFFGLPPVAVEESNVKIAKVLNNNIAIAVDDKGRDVIVMGCGVALQKRYGDPVDESKVSVSLPKASPNSPVVSATSLLRFPRSSSRPRSPSSPMPR